MGLLDRDHRWRHVLVPGGLTVSRYTIQRYCAKNDANGNPRRVYVIRNGDGAIVATVDEGYEGRVAWCRALADLTGWIGKYAVRMSSASAMAEAGVTDLGDVDVSPGVYRRMVKYVPEVKQ